MFTRLSGRNELTLTVCYLRCNTQQSYAVRFQFLQIPVLHWQVKPDVPFHVSTLTSWDAFLLSTVVRSDYYRLPRGSTSTFPLSYWLFFCIIKHQSFFLKPDDLGWETVPLRSHFCPKTFTWMCMICFLLFWGTAGDGGGALHTLD